MILEGLVKIRRQSPDLFQVNQQQWALYVKISFRFCRHVAQNSLDALSHRGMLFRTNAVEKIKDATWFQYVSPAELNVLEIM